VPSGGGPLGVGAGVAGALGELELPQAARQRQAAATDNSRGRRLARGFSSSPRLSRIVYTPLARFGRPLGAAEAVGEMIDRRPGDHEWW